MNSENIDLQAFDYIIGKVTDGVLFEKFAQALLCQIIGVDFVPLGGVKDRGLDGLDHTWQQKNDPRTVYQISIEADPRSKILRTLKKLKENTIPVQRLSYVTNREIRDQDKLMEEVYQKETVILQCRDIAWLRGNVPRSEATLRVYADFVRNNAHQRPLSGPSLIVTDFAADPRVFVFLRQQLDSKSDDSNLRDLLVDSLILYGLEGTDPDKGILRSRDDIIAEVANVITFPINQIDGLIDGRLKYLSTRPRQINKHNKLNKYCLPYETRLKLDEQRARDAALYEEFNRTAEERLNSHLKLQKVQMSHASSLLSQTINQIFKKQGLDFADFVLHQKDPKAVENALPDVIASVLESSGVPPPIRGQAGLALQGTIREIIYRGTKAELEYIQKLSRAYMLLFLVQCDPRVCDYFDSLAGKLKVFVCNSILVPALSEIGLRADNRRHWNLLLHARNAGVKLFVNKVTLAELVGHIRMSIQAYDEHYRGMEEHYSDERTLRYVDLILLRAYFYHKAQGDPITFDEFIDKFVSPRARIPIMSQEMISFLQDEFGIQFVDDAALGVDIDSKSLSTLAAELEKLKQTTKQAENDARTILGIYASREKNNESGSAGVFGYKTWWLSKDTTTHRAVISCFKNKQHVSCYLRPDFLVNYIALSARSGHASKVFDQMFPTLIGVSLSHHVTPELSHGVHNAIKKHKEMSAARVKAVIGSLSTRLMTDGGLKGKHLRHVLDDAFDKGSRR